MEWSDIIKVVSATLLSVGSSGAIILALSSWLGKVWANRIHEKEQQKYRLEFEEIRSKLEVERHKLNTMFNVVHEKRALIIGKFYSKLKKTEIKLARLVHLFQGPGGPLPEKRKEVTELFLDASNYYYEHKIYFDSSTWSAVESVFNLMKDSIIAFDLSRDNMSQRTEDFSMWQKAHSIMQREVPPVLESLENSFRNLLGIKA